MSALKLTITVLVAFATCFAVAPWSAWAEPLEPPPSAPPTGGSGEMPAGPPPGSENPPATAAPVAPDEDPVAPPMPAARIEDLNLSTALPGRMPSRNGPALPAAVGHERSEMSGLFGQWRVRLEHAITMPKYVGQVIDQFPAAGEPLARGEVVTVLVGVAGLPSPAYACVPRIEGMPGKNAVAALKRAGFGVLLRTVASSDGDRGVVLAQAPRPSSVAPRNLKVTVVVGTGGLVVGRTPTPPTAALPGPLPPPVEPIVPRTPEHPVMPPGPPPGSEPREPRVVEPPVVSPPVVSPPVSAPAEPPVIVPVPVERPVVTPLRPVVPVPHSGLRPSHPTLLSPAHGKSFPQAYGSTFRWTVVSGAKAYEWELQVEARDGSWSRVATKTVEATRYRPARVDAGRYRWRVRALRAETAGAWSPFHRLYMYGP